LIAAAPVLPKIAKRMVRMDPTSPESQPQPQHHHPVPPGLVRFYGLFAVLFVLLPEWMADLRQMSRNVRIQAREVDRDRLSITLRRRLEARRRRALKTTGGLANPELTKVHPLSRSARLARSRVQWRLTGARAALWVALGAGLVWGANQLRPLPRLSLPQVLPPQAGRSEQPTPSAVAAVPVGQLRLQSSGPSWVEVRSLAGPRLYAAILDGQVQLPLGRGVKVLAGRPDLVRVYRAGHQPKMLGRIDQIAWVVFQVP